MPVAFACVVYGAVPPAATGQTTRLEEDAQVVIARLTELGVTDRDGLVHQLRVAWEAERSDEYRLLRVLGIEATDAEFDRGWQNQPGRAPQFDPYDVEAWTTDVLRSWGRQRPREAFTWLYAVRSTFGFSLPRRQCLLRIVQDWSRGTPDESDEAEAVALSLRDSDLRAEVIAGVARGRILNADRRGVEELMAELTDESLLADLRALAAAYLR